MLACLVSICGLAAASTWALPAHAAAPDDGWSYDLSRELMSPFCPGRTLASCPSPQAAELIQWMKLQEAAGASRAEVEEQLYARYGDVMRGAPKPEGWGLAAYVIPPLAALAGVGLVVLVLRRLAGRGGERGRSAAAPAEAAASKGASAPVDDDEIAKIVDRELERI
jgi:cytochrome c-type biogenesis protein CcmH/NrfF